MFRYDLKYLNFKQISQIKALYNNIKNYLKHIKYCGLKINSYFTAV